MSSEQSRKINEIRWGGKNNRNWALFQEMHDNGESASAVRVKLGWSYPLFARAKRDGFISVHPVPRAPMTQESKEKISSKRKKWLANNPDKHPWRNKDKFQSKPCQKAKEFLSSLGVQFIEEYCPDIEGRFFSIDIAIPDKMVAIEINGNQHYERNGELKPYYQERHDLLEANGWTVYEVHYSACFALEKWADFVNQLTSAAKKVEFDYFNYTTRGRKTHHCCDCQTEVYSQSARCATCNGLKNQKELLEPLPEKEVLQKLLFEVPTISLAKRFGLSDNGFAKRIKKMGLTKPDRGYWQKQRKRG